MLSIPLLGCGVWGGGLVNHIFRNGVQGWWYEPTEGQRFQDVAGTVPALATEPVRLWLDKSPRGNHRTAPSDAARPVVQADGGAEFDGVDDQLVSSFNGPFTPYWTVIVAVQRGSNASSHPAGRLSSNSGANDYWEFGGTTSERLQFRTRFLSIGADTLSTLSFVGSYPATPPILFTGVVRPIPGDIEHRINGAPSGTSTVPSNLPDSLSAGTTQTYRTPQAATSTPAMRIYGEMAINRLLSADELAEVEAYFTEFLP